MDNILGLSEYATWHIIVFTINILLFLFANIIVTFLNNGLENTKQLSLFRFLNISFLLFHILDWIMLFLHQNYENFFFNLGMTLVMIYTGMLVYHVGALFSRRKFGISKEVDSNVMHYDSYSSRMVNILMIVVLTLMILMYIIKLWGFNSLLETTGLFGLVVAFLALTNSIWAPDLYYGLVILNSNMLEDGDVVTFSEQTEHLYIISKVTFVYTILLDVTNNHRIMIRNAKMVDATINNLSKKASIDGLRYHPTYKIGYPKEEFSYEEYKSKIDDMFTDAQKEVFEDDRIKINTNIEFSWLIKETGDHAVEFVLTYNILSLPATRSTKKIREYLISTPRLINEAVFKSSLKHGVSLSTPFIIQSA